MNVYPFIEAEKRQRRNVKRACELLKVSRAAYYAARHGQLGPREREDVQLLERIRSVHEDSKGRYGAPRIHVELRRAGHRHGRKRIARLMRAGRIRGRAPKRWRKTTIPDPVAAARADLIRRDFSVDASRLNARWCGDITYVPTWEGWPSPAAGSWAGPPPITYAPNWSPTPSATQSPPETRKPVSCSTPTAAANTPATTTASSPMICRSASPSDAPANAGTTRSPRASSPR